MDPYTSPEHGRSALVTIDVQCDFLDGHPLEVRGTSAVVPRIAQVARFFRAQGRPIVHVVRLYRPDATNVDVCRREGVEQGAQLLIAGSPGSQLVAPLLPVPDILLDAEFLLGGGMQPIGEREWLMYKPRWGAFFETPLEAHLRSLDVSTLVFAGCNWPNCPRTSIYEASERDFRIVVLSDAISGLYPQGLEELRGIGAMTVDTAAYVREAARG